MKLSWRTGRWLLLWFTLIFATSCTVVPFDAFVGFVGSHGRPLWNDEWHQTFIPGRGGNVRDALIDTAGALTPARILVWREQQKRKKNRNGVPLP